MGPSDWISWAIELVLPPSAELLDQVSLAGPALPQLSHHIKLMIAGGNLLTLNVARLRVLSVLRDVRQPERRKNVLP
jgi:hypothetical protein